MGSEAVIHRRRAGFLDRLIPVTIMTSAVFLGLLIALASWLSSGIVHWTLLAGSTAILVLGLIHLARRWAVFTSMEARETSIFALGAMILFLAPLRETGAMGTGADLASAHLLLWLGVGGAFVATASALLARRAGFFGPWLVGIICFAVVAWHHGTSLSVQYTFRDMVYLGISLFLVSAGAMLHIHSMVLRRRVASAIGHRARGDLHTALQLYDSALQLNPRDELLWNNRGNVLADLRKYEQAMLSYQRALDISPGYSVARGNMAQVEKRAGRSARARTSEADRRTHRFMRAWRGRLVYQWGWFFGIVVISFFGVQLTIVGRPELYILGASIPMYALFDLMIAIALMIFVMNRAVKTLTYRAVLARLDGELPRALRYYDLALKLNPFNDILWNNRGNILTKMGKYDQADKSYRKALELFPGQPAAVRNQKVMGRKRTHPGINLKKSRWV